MIILELQKYWKKFRAFSDIFVSALRLTCTGSYCISRRCFSERTSRLRGYFKNIQQRLFICLVWSSGDVPLVYGSFGSRTVVLKLVLHFFYGTHLLLAFKTALGCFSLILLPLSISPNSPLSHLSLLWFSHGGAATKPPPEHHRLSPTYQTSRVGLGEHPCTTLTSPQWPETAPPPQKCHYRRLRIVSWRATKTRPNLAKSSWIV